MNSWFYSIILYWVLVLGSGVECEDGWFLRALPACLLPFVGAKRVVVHVSRDLQRWAERVRFLGGWALFVLWGEEGRE